MPLRMLCCVLLSASLLLGATAWGDNRVGDANNDGNVDVADAAIVQARLYGSVGADVVSPLALADGDGDLDLKDLLLVGQAANGIRVITGPGSWLSFNPPPAVNTTSGDSPLSVTWEVFSGFPGVAADTTGLTATLQKMPVGAESLLSPSNLSIAANSAVGWITPINTTGATDNFAVPLTVSIADSSGNLLQNAVWDVSITVVPSICGNGWVQPGETCDDGDADPCTPACNATCAGPSTPPICGNGILDCGEACDNGTNGNPCDGCLDACILTCGNSTIECSETCDDGTNSGLKHDDSRYGYRAYLGTIPGPSISNARIHIYNGIGESVFIDDVAFNISTEDKDGDGNPNWQEANDNDPNQ